MIEFPKMLYKDSAANSTTVNDEHEEQSALQAGYVEHHELPEDVPFDDELPDDLEAHIVNLEDHIVTLQLENIDLLEKLAAYENQRTDEQAKTTDSSTSQNVGSVDYSEWTNSQLQKAIVDAGKTYNKRDSKAELINILQGEK